MPQVQLSASINLNFSTSQPYFVFEYLSPLIWHRNDSVFNIHRWISVFRRKKQFVITLQGLQVITIFMIQENFLKRPVGEVLTKRRMAMKGELFSKIMFLTDCI